MKQISIFTVFLMLISASCSEFVNETSKQSGYITIALNDSNNSITTNKPGKISVPKFTLGIDVDISSLKDCNFFQMHSSNSFYWREIGKNETSLRLDSATLKAIYIEDQFVSFMPGDYMLLFGKGSSDNPKGMAPKHVLHIFCD